MEHLKPIISHIRSAQVNNPPSPWKKVTDISVGGLIAVGFVEDDDLLLIISSTGRSVVDCLTGEKIARDYQDAYDNEATWYDEIKLTGQGIGPLEYQTIQLSGLHGGGLSSITKDGWYVQSITLEWPQTHLLLVHQPSTIYKEDSKFTKLAIESEVRAFGFSHTGRTLIIATSSDVTIYGRKISEETV